MPIHIVSPGDTVYSIARQYGVSPRRIISDNGILNPRNLPIGQALLILIPQVIYTIEPGDTLYSIARKNGVEEILLLQNNPTLVNLPYLPAGQSIVISYEGKKIGELTVNGYVYPYVRTDVLRRALPYLTMLTIFGYGFTEAGELIAPEDEFLIRQAFEFQAAPILLFSSITEDGGFSGERASLLFQSRALQDKILEELLATMKQKGYRGIDIDFEYVNPEDAGAFVEFLRNVTEKMNKAGFTVNTDLAPKTSAFQKGLLYEAHNYERIGQLSDTALIMTYEWGYTYGPPMAVAPLNKVRQVVEYATGEIPGEKLFLGLPNYGYDWTLPFEKGVTKATSIGNQYAVELASRNGAEILFDSVAKSPYFEYYGLGGRKHIVWFEDVRSMGARFDLIDEFSLLGGGYWNLMRPFQQNWGLLASRYLIRKLP